MSGANRDRQVLERRPGLYDPRARPDVELLVCGRRCPRCSARLNIRISTWLVAALASAPRKQLVQTVECRFYKRPRGICGTLVEVLVEDVLKSRSEAPGSARDRNLARSVDRATG